MSTTQAATSTAQETHAITQADAASSATTSASPSATPSATPVYEAFVSVHNSYSLMPTNFPPLRNDNLLRAAQRKPVDRVPVWLMRQAGRYLPEFRQVRAASDFFTVCRTPTLACEVTLQPLRRYDFDASIIFSDILVVLQAMGMEVQMQEKKGPVLPKPLTDPNHVKAQEQGGYLIDNVNVHSSLGYVFEAITRTRHAIDGKVPLIGFIGAPFTLMAYAVEGGGSKAYTKVKSWLYKYPEASHTLLQKITDVCVDFLVGQVEAGAQMLQVFDSWAGELSPDAFNTFCLPYLTQIAKRVREQISSREEYVPFTIFAKGSHYALAQLSEAGYDVVGLDWTVTPQVARAAVGDRVTLQGNMDPCVLFASHDRIRQEARAMLDQFGTKNYIANLGHGMLPEHDPAAVSVLVDEIHAYSEQLIAQNK